MQKSKARSRFIVACVAPATILTFIFMAVPTFNIFRMSLLKWGGYSSKKTFVGLDNFIILFQDEKFFSACRNSILLIVLVTLATSVFALLLAYIFTREKIHGKNLFRVLFYIPNILSVVAIGAIFCAIYDSDRGLLNGILNIFCEGANRIYWLGNQKLVIYSLAIAMVWQAIGYYMVMYMASMSSIPESLYESAMLAGASRTQIFFSITLPLIWTNIRTTLTFYIISNINTSFLFVKAMTDGGPDGASGVFLSYMYKQAYTNSTYGYGMAVGVVVFIFSLTLAAVVNQVTKREILEF